MPKAKKGLDEGDIFGQGKSDKGEMDIFGQGKGQSDKELEGTMDIFGDSKKQGKGQDDIFGFNSELSGKKKGKGKKDDLDIGNIYGDLG